MVTDLIATQRPGDHLARPGFSVYTTWCAFGQNPTTETRQVHHDWPTAVRQALRNACCAGARYVTVCGPGDVVHGEWDRYTNRWREYHRPGGEEF